jgi:hypothetical protein
MVREALDFSAILAAHHEERGQPLPSHDAGGASRAFTMPLSFARFAQLDHRSP